MPTSTLIPRTIEEVRKLIQNEVMESIHLDYKASEALDGKPGEITKDISAFANSDGGTIIYGVVEEGHRPDRLDKGIDHTKRTREWLEAIIQSNVSPTLDELEIVQIPINEKRSIYVVSVRKSMRAPHQDGPSKRYYKRQNFRSVPMEDYELQDIRNRQFVLSPLIHVDIEIEQGIFFELFVQNVGQVPAQNIKFQFSEQLFWARGEPPQFTNGIRTLPPGKKLAFYYATGPETFRDHSRIVKTFSVTVSYLHPKANQRLTDTFEIDLESFERTSIVRSDLYHHGKTVGEGLKKIGEELRKLNSNLDALTAIAGPTGLDLSATTIRNLASLGDGEVKLERYNAADTSYRAFEEILGIDRDLAMRLERYFRFRSKDEQLEDIEELDADKLALLRKHFFTGES